MSTSSVGDAAEMDAMAYFRRKGWVVGKPWGSAPFDLFVDDGVGVRRVEVKSTVRRGHTERGGKPWGWVSICDPSKPFDLLFVHTPDAWYLIPVEALGSKRSVTTTPSADDYPTASKWAQYRIK